MDNHLNKQTMGNRLRPAFTLPELVISLAVTTLLMAGLGSAMLLASRAVPNDNEPLKAQALGLHVLERIAAELTVAKTIVLRSANMIEFTVEDRNADAVDEQFRYTWAGTPGGMLWRSIAGGPLVGETMSDNVYNFNIVYDIRIDSAGLSRLHTAQLQLQIGNNPDAIIQFGVQLLNTPEVTP